MPTTRLGRLALRLDAAAAALFVVFFALVAAGERGGDTFFSNPWLAGSILGAAAAAVAGGAVGVTAVARRGERSRLVYVVILFGALVVAWVVLEIAFPH